MAFWIRDIPASMRREGWTVGAQLMDRWFATAARSMTRDEKNGLTPPTSVPAAFVEGRIVTMAWVLRFARAREAHDRLLRTWNQGRLEASSDLIRTRLRRALAAGLGANARSFRFGDLSRSLPVIDVTCQANREGVNSGFFDGVDDFYAGIANALIKVAVTGIVTRTGPSRLRLEIDEVGTYLRDTYDFIGEQGLGSWGPSGISRAALLAPEVPVTRAERGQAPQGQLFCSVGNASFRRYRELHSRGGDFLIFSDLRRVRLAQPTVVEMSL